MPVADHLIVFLRALMQIARKEFAPGSDPLPVAKTEVSS